MEEPDEKGEGVNYENRKVLLNAATVIVVILACFLLDALDKSPKDDDAYVLAKDGTAVAQWDYQQLPMRECWWCGRTVDLNRHHVVPQAANPALRVVRENLIVLCRNCHFVLGHRCNWKRYNPDVLYIATHFTNCVRSSDSRHVGVPNPDWRTTVTNEESFNETIGRLFDEHQGKHTN